MYSYRFQSLSFMVEMINSQFFPLKICEELSAKQKSESQQILSLQNRQVESWSGQFVKDFIPNCRIVFFFLPITTEVMGIWRFAGAFAVVKRQSECGSKTAGMHVSQPMNKSMCYGLGVCLYI